MIGRVKGKVAIMSDDMIVTGGTLLAGARALKDAGATAVYACATHGLFPEGTLREAGGERARRGGRHGHGADQPARATGQPQVLTVSRILAQSIQNVFCDESVSAIFAGQNQLF